MNFDFGTGTDRNLNFASLGFVIAALLTCIITLLMVLFGGGGGNDRPGRVLPPTISIPTATVTLTPTITRTPLPATFTPTFTPSFTPQPSLTASPTFTTSPTLSVTPTITTTSLPTETPTDTVTPAPTLGTPPPSPPPLPFITQGDVAYNANFNASGCAWQGIGGQVLGTDGGAYPNQLVISVTGGGLAEARTSLSNTNSLYGTGGYEIQLTNSINTQTYFVSLLTPSGTPVSEVIQVTFPGACESNLALISFQATR